MSSVQLSVIIVSYNVKYFLRQCLQSVERALEGIAGEVWVVDNASVDGSLEMVKTEFPWVNLIANDTNVGFAKANNQAIRRSRGEYILLLNPDTIVQEDTFHKVLAFFKEHPEAGAVGVKIIDGNGRFAYDSRRDFPSGWNIFTKITGLYRLWPKSKLFGGYHLTYLPEDRITPVPVLLGAFMCIPRKVLDEVGLLDERFFMYAEDIDLCYRIAQAGYTNYYLPTTQIIHFKGESTKLHSLSYVLAFYKASLQFIQKHYRGWKRWPAAFLYQVGILVAATISASKRIFQRVAFPITEWATLWGVGYGLTMVWSASTGKKFPDFYYTAILPLYALWVVIAHLGFMNYAAPYRIRKVIGAAITGFLLIVLTGYFLPPINYSRFIAAAVAFGGVPIGLAMRALHNWLRQGRLHLTGEISQRVLIVAAPEHLPRLSQASLSGYSVSGGVSGLCESYPPPASLRHPRPAPLHHRTYQRRGACLLQCQPLVPRNHHPHDSVFLQAPQL
jgi:GT2 family glycosyltransferase